MLKIVKSKAATLAALYNHSAPLGMGFLQAIPGDMTEEQAQEYIDGKPAPDYPVLSQRHCYFDYLHGRVLKVNLVGDEFNPDLYDRDNGQGAAERALASIKP